jgi:hypothetical protein
MPRSVRIANHRLCCDEKIIGPLPLGPWYPQLTKRGLVCVTETMTRAEIERFAAPLGRVLLALGYRCEETIPRLRASKSYCDRKC